MSNKWEKVYRKYLYDATNDIVTRNENLLMNPYYFKSSHWKYEKEWRMVIPENLATDKEYFADFHKGISGVYLGLKSFDCHKVKVDKIIEEYSQKRIPVYKIYKMLLRLTGKGCFKNWLIYACSVNKSKQM